MHNLYSIHTFYIQYTLIKEIVKLNEVKFFLNIDVSFGGLCFIISLKTDRLVLYIYIVDKYIPGGAKKVALFDLF
jgi:hypothetical protein